MTHDDSSDPAPSGRKPGGVRLFFHSEDGPYGSLSRGAHRDAGDCLIDGGALLETEHVLLRCAPGLVSHLGEIRTSGRSDVTQDTVAVGFNRYRICIPREASQEILEALRGAIPGCRSDGIHHLFRLIAIWEDVCCQR